jgi:hypothetical protein
MVSGPEKSCWPNVEVDENAQEVVLHRQVSNFRGVKEMESQSSKYTMDHSRVNVEDKIISLFEPDTLVSAQYLENLLRKTVLEPEKRLVLAVLEDAINCFQVNVMAERGRRKKLFKESEDWIMGRDDDWIFSFVSVCELLRFNPEYVRRGLLRWKEKKLARNPTPHSRGKKMMAGYSLAANGH